MDWPQFTRKKVWQGRYTNSRLSPVLLHQLHLCPPAPTTRVRSIESLYSTAQYSNNADGRSGSRNCRSLSGYPYGISAKMPRLCIHETALPKSHSCAYMQAYLPR
ncbi:hypothetical protein VFPPC_15286 [Pochonia chlamydosporia 170]|uniref:Uncharacterized protein n=1 Tax=Pochonia chlamydosporia 170 TaxID=1380566 RepID=A0A179G820_METCM|nr:hypothetical protein VFPPC_15286 [Pochonia chlamydosporia 170]OAQ73319.2 hypothetical protein VFPPC_15286 [Pochonia chlamydosporia 170]